MIEGIHTGKGAFLKNFRDSRPAVASKCHPNALEEPDPTHDLSHSIRAMGEYCGPLLVTGPEFDFEELH